MQLSTRLLSNSGKNSSSESPRAVNRVWWTSSLCWQRPPFETGGPQIISGQCAKKKNINILLWLLWLRRQRTGCMRIVVRICFTWPWLVILMIPCAQTLDTHSEQTGNTFVVKVWLIWLWKFFFYIACSKATKQHPVPQRDNHRQSSCLCRNFFHHDWFWPLKHQANWINMMFPVLLLSALLNPSLRKQRLTV